jgi:hypothetical protein
VTGPGRAAAFSVLALRPIYVHVTAVGGWKSATAGAHPSAGDGVGTTKIKDTILILYAK